MDARLVPLAVSMWLSSAVVTYAAGRLDPIAIIVLLAISLSSALLMPKLKVRTALLTIIIGTIAGTSIALVRTIPLQNDFVASAIADEQIVTLAGVVANDPVQFERKQALDWSSQSAAVVEISLSSMSVGDATNHLRVPVSVFSTSQTAEQIMTLLPGTKVQIVGKIKAASAGRKYAATVNATSIEVAQGAPNYQQGSAHLRAGLHDALGSYSQAAQGLVPGLALGDSSALGEQLKADMRSAGLTHLVAVSGANVALLLALINRLVYRRSQKFQLLTSLVALSAYVTLVRPQPSVVRAAAMAVVVLMAYSVHWRIHALPALCLAVVLLVAFDPWLSTSYGFVLSTLATVGLITISSPLQNSLERSLPQRLPKWIIKLLALTTAAQLAVLPITIGLSTQISLGAIPANVIAVPLATPAMFSGLLAAALAVISVPLASLSVLPGVWSAQVIAGIAHFTANATFATVTFPAGISGVLIGFLFVFITMDIWKRWASAREQERKFLSTFVAVSIFLVWWRPDLNLQPWPSAPWQFVVCDVGQGDGLVLRTGAHSAIVLDAGSEPEPIDQCLRDLQITYVSLFVMTHFHADHVGGIQGVFKHRTVNRVWVTALQEPELTTAFALTCLQQHKISPEVIGQLHHEVIGNVDLQVVWPARIIRGQGSDPNNASIAIVATIGAHRLFLAGDLEPAAQSAILQSWPVPQVDVLKVAHHGSANQYPPFIERLQPEDSVISVGTNNDYGHPALETIALLDAVGSRIWRTDTDGALAVVVHGDDWVVEPQK